MAEVKPTTESAAQAFSAGLSMAMCQEIVDQIQRDVTDEIVGQEMQVQACIVTVTTLAQLLLLQVSKGMSAGIKDPKERRIRHRAIYASACNKIRDGGVRISFADIAEIPIDKEAGDEPNPIPN